MYPSCCYQACLAEEVLETADCFVSKSEPIATLLEKVDYLLSLRILFRPLPALTKTGPEEGERQPSRDLTGSHRTA
jgi:hypothetical protein